MHLGRATWLLPLILLSGTPALCLPVSDRQSATSQSLAPRATYSVVPIDGGSGSSGSGNSGGSGGGSGGSDGPGSGSGSGSGNAPPGAATITITVVQTRPPTTSVHTVYVTSPASTQRVTETVVVTKTIQVVDVATVPATSTTSRPPTGPLTSIAIPLQTGFSSTATTATTTTGSRTTTHDNGMWHTTYPAWNGTVWRRGSRNVPRPRRVL